MSQSRALQQHIEHLTEIRSILHSLKNMAFMDMHKLSKLRQAQVLVVKHIENVAADFLQFYPDIVIAVGSRLCNRLQNTDIVFSALSGANCSDEISQVLGNVTDGISELHRQHTLFNLSVLFHQDEHLNITMRAILPPFKNIDRQSEYKNEPLINLQSTQFLLELIEHYVFSSLQDILYTSLAAENNQRLQHLDNAVRHLDETTEKLHKKSQVYRQEEITEEIEVILLNEDNEARQM